MSRGAYTLHMAPVSYKLWSLFPLPTSALPMQLPLTIGRNPACDVHLPDDDVSRFHASLELRDGGVVLVDQGSRNGLYINGRRQGVAPLSPYAVVRIGQAVLWFGPQQAFQEVLAGWLERHATSAATVLLVGEQGVGRRTIAERIHRKSGREGSLVTLAGDVDQQLMALLKGGTVLCTEPTDLAALDERAQRYDVRLLATSTHAVSLSEVEVLNVPPLRRRLDEMVEALTAMLSEDGVHAAFNADMLEALACHGFALNFSELQAMARGLAGRSRPLEIDDLAPSMRANLVEARSEVDGELTREQLDDALTRHRGNVRRMGHELGMARAKLYRLLAGMGLNPDLYRQLQSPIEPPRAMREERRTQT